MSKNKDLDWETVARDLAAALGSFLAYDGYGQGGAGAANLGNWAAADDAMDQFNDMAGGAE
jgi:hypothetical protein